MPTGEPFDHDYEGEIPPLELDTSPNANTYFKLKIPGRLAFRVYDEFDRESITPLPDGSLQVEAHFPMDSWVVGYLFSFGTDVEILEPPELRRELAEYVEKIAVHHKP